MIVESILTMLAVGAACDSVHKATNPTSSEKRAKDQLRKIQMKQKRLDDEIKRKNKEMSAYSKAYQADRKRR